MPDNINLARLKKDEIIWMANHRCSHSHTFISHPQCYLVAVPDATKIGFLDLECSHLTADIGIVLTWAIKVENEDEIIEGRISKADIDASDKLLFSKDKDALKGVEDMRIIQELTDAMVKFDKIVGYYSTNFDVPFARTRSLVDGLEFPEYGSLKHTDAFYMAKPKLALLSKSQKNVARAILGATEKTEISWPIWRAAARGNTEALDYVQEHNRADVRDLERIYHKLLGYTARKERTI